MANPREYGKVGLYPGLRAQRKREHAKIYRLQRQLEKAREEYGTIGYSYCTGGACCVACKRYIDAGALRASSESPRNGPILPAACCDHCGRLPIDQALIDQGRLRVQSDPQWATERVRVADMRATFAMGDKVIPSKREVDSA